MTGSCANPAEIAWLERLFATTPDGEGVEAVLEGARDRWRQPEGARHWRRWFAPLAPLEGCWLDGVVTVANAHTRLGTALLRLQQALLRWPVPEAVTTPCDDSALQSHRRWLLAMARWGDRFLPEAIGLTRAHVALAGGMFALGQGRDWSAPRRVLAEVLRCWRPCGTERRRMEAGVRLYRRCTSAWCRAWLADGETGARVRALLRHKARYGRGYHGRIRLRGRSLDDWLAEAAAGNEAALIRALLDSPYLDRDDPDASRLLRAVEFGGPMYGVFTREECRLLRRWLAAPRLPLAGGDGDAGMPPPPAAETPAASPSLSCPALYHRLLDPRLRPGALPAARRLVGRVLARSRRYRGFFPWSPERFREYLDRCHRRAQGEDASPWPWLSAGACRWGIEQLAPAVLVDGCWLQQSARLARMLPEVGHPLRRIYREELGDGVTARHHGNLYRRLLDQAGIDLPPFTSHRFIRHPGFLPAAFDLPAYLLAIGTLADEFLPELLGLNLAIELSGLGNVYQRLAATLEAHGFDAGIVRLHQSIDNLADGHAARARDAIVAYLQRFEPGGEAAVAEQWRRVWHGWRSLETASRRFARQLVLGWVRRFAVAEWRGWVSSW